MPMNHRLLVPRQTLHPEALAWRSAAIANGDTGITPAMVNAVSQWFRDVASIRSKLYRVNLFVGSGLPGVLVPQVRGPVFGGTTYGNATDTNNNFIAADYNETGSSAGLIGNGSTKSLLTGFLPNVLTPATTHIGCIITVPGAATNKACLGAFVTGSSAIDLYSRGNIFGATWLASALGNAASDRGGPNVGTGGASLPAGRHVRSGLAFYTNGAAAGTDATTTGSFPASEIAIFAVRRNDGSLFYNSNDRLGGYFVGGSMTAAQALSFDAALSSFAAAMGRPA